jgi:hypothetical protein
LAEYRPRNWLKFQSSRALRSAASTPACYALALSTCAERREEICELRGAADA